MTPRLREEYDADLIKPNEPTEYKSGLSRYELTCDACGRTLYVDKETLEKYKKAMEYDLDNQFICSECEREYEDLAYE